MRIALVQPTARCEMDRHWAKYPVLGLGYLAGALRAQGHEVRLFDGKLAALSMGEIVSGVSAFSPELVGITCMTIDFLGALDLAREIKQTLTVPIVLGGAHVNAVGAQVLEECPWADYACVQEGEYLVCELADAIVRRQDPSAILGLVWRRDGRPVFNGPRPYPADYNAIPFPAWDLFAVRDEIPVLTQRGCPFQCNFCGHNSGFRPRYRSPENVLEELESIVERFNPRMIRFEDETFGLDLARTKRILRGILERGLNDKVVFSAQTRVDRIDEEFLALLKAARFETLEIGVESGHPGVLERMRKGITLNQVERAIRLAKGAGIRIWCKYILGHPHETRREMFETIKFIARTNPDQLSIAVMTPFPGTPIFEMAIRGEGGYRLLASDWASFDKYSSGVLELEKVRLGELKLLQLLAYLVLYTANGRFPELFRLVAGHWKMAMAMLSGALRAFLRTRTKRSVELPRIAPSAEWKAFRAGGGAHDLR